MIITEVAEPCVTDAPKRIGWLINAARKRGLRLVVLPEAEVESRAVRSPCRRAGLRLRTKTPH